MSKRNLALVLVVGAVMATSAYADRAHNLVTGTGDAGVILGGFGSTGSFYTDDAYNMFYNPAYVNDYKNWAIIEKSNYSEGVTALNSAGTPNGTRAQTGTSAQGGFATGIGNFNMALFFNRQDDLMDAVYTGAGAGIMRPVDLLVGGDAGFAKWGLGVSYASASTQPNPTITSATSTSTDLVVRAGLEWNDLDPFINWRVLGTDNGLTTGPSNKGVTGGLRYHWGEWTPYAAFRWDSYNGTKDYEAYGVGLGRTTKLTDAIRMGYSLAYFRQAVSLSSTPGDANLFNGASVGDRSVVPVEITASADAASWLTLMAGLGYNFMDRIGGVTVADNTTGRLGATVHAGKADFDFAVGQGSNALPSNEGANDTNAQSFDIAHQFFTASSLSYHW